MTTYDIPRLLEDFYVDYKPANSRGWYGITCPYCLSDSKYKMGLRNEGIAYCWSCSGRPFDEVIKLITNQNWRDIRLAYADESGLDARDKYLLEHANIVRPVKLEMPDHIGPLDDLSKRYLSGRGLDPYELESIFKLQSTNHRSRINRRIVIPIIMESRTCSWTARDITNRSPLRYISCAKEQEIIPHKNLLYNYDNIQGDEVICVEGCFDVFKLKRETVATFGTSFTQGQINLLGSFRKVNLLYDSEDEARRRCDSLAEQLAGLGVEVSCIYLKGDNDPGDLSQADADALVKDILGG